MGFSRAQQGKFRPLVQQAWKLHARGNGLRENDVAARRAWYESVLENAGLPTTTAACNHKDDFNFAMAAFEAIAGDSIYWQMRAFNNDARRILFKIREICIDHDLDEAYAAGIARQQLGCECGEQYLQLDRLPAEKLLKILQALRIHIARWDGLAVVHEVPAKAEEADENCPF